ncbi:hypothetical protein [Actinomadura opuntiae]|uniref:hypothetical protein n=1 Tax=Actinomadura sp. OS1-43 TaxID=604315 RepID=UPI00255B05FF|nr:hypothetical protein [Actinomadura sp. OS1-43]MDL4816532.1 hypothetical protein [Actinomadura sp. OS1-43]
MRRSDRIAWWAFGIVVILGGVAVSGMLADPPPREPASVDEFCPPQPTGKARDDTSFKETADPYRGRGPHAVKLLFADANTGEGADELPSRWQVGDTDVKPKAQLVACGYQDTAGTRETRVCEYVPETTARLYWQLSGSTRPKNTTKISLLKASYVFEIYEAKTAKPLGRFEVPGDEACPWSVKLDDRTSIEQAPDASKLRKALRPYAERTIT